MAAGAITPNDRSAHGRRAPGWLAGAALVVLTVAVYLPLIIQPYPFLVEERLTFEQNPYMAEPTLANWWGLVSQPHYTDYTPVGWTLQFATVAVFGPSDIRAIRSVSLLLQVAVVLLLWRLLATWVPARPWLVWVAAAIYAVHPVSLEQVVWTPAQKWLLSVALAIAAMLAWWRARGGTPQGGAGAVEPAPLRVRWVAVSIGLFLLALFSKGGVIVLPVLLLAAEWTVGRQPLRRALWRTAPLFVVAIAFGLFASALHTHSPNVAYIGGSRITSVASHLPALLRTIGHWVFPLAIDETGLRSPLAFYYRIDVVHDAATWAWAIGSGVLALLALAAAWWAAGRTRAATLGVLWFLICQALVMGLFPHQWWHMADRYTCLGAGGLLLVLGLAVSRVVNVVGLRLMERARRVQQAAAGEPELSPAQIPDRRRELRFAVPVVVLALAIVGNGTARWMWQDVEQFRWQNLTSQPGGIGALQFATFTGPKTFYSGLRALPLDQPLTELGVPDPYVTVMAGTPQALQIRVLQAVLATVSTPHAADLMYIEAYADVILFAALTESWQQRDSGHSGDTDGPLGERLRQHVDQYAGNPRVALRAAVYQMGRGRPELAEPWLAVWRDSAETGWQTFVEQAAAADVTPETDPPTDAVTAFRRNGDYVRQLSILAEYFVFIELAVRAAVARGDQDAAVRVLRVARMLYPSSERYRGWLRAALDGSLGA